MTRLAFLASLFAPLVARKLPAVSASRICAGRIMAVNCVHIENISADRITAGTITASSSALPSVPPSACG